MTDKDKFKKMVAMVTCTCGWTGQYYETLVSCMNRDTVNFEDVSECPKCRKPMDEKGGNYAKV